MSNQEHKHDSSDRTPQTRQDNLRQHKTPQAVYIASILNPHSSLLTYYIISSQTSTYLVSSRSHLSYLIYLTYLPTSQSSQRPPKSVIVIDTRYKIQDTRYKIQDTRYNYKYKYLSIQYPINTNRMYTHTHSYSYSYSFIRSLEV